MGGRHVLAYFGNCFWLVVPVLAFDYAFIDRLPPAFQMDVFWRDISAVIGVPENVFRIAILLLPLLMPLAIVSPRQRLGVAFYVSGLALYFVAWCLLIWFPDAPWSKSALGVMAPAYTPLLWLTGIGLIGDRLFVTRVPYRWWIYVALSLIFLVFHNIHAAIVYTRYY